MTDKKETKPKFSIGDIIEIPDGNSKIKAEVTEVNKGNIMVKYYVCNRYWFRSIPLEDK